MSGASTISPMPGPDDLIRIFEGLGFVTRSPRLVPMLQQSWKVARVSDTPILIEGETGTGKMVLAEAIHRLDPKRASHPFVIAPCATIPASVAESELFGHARGAFSGAVEERLGLFRSGDHGTLFLDDVSDLPLQLQPKLLDVLQRRTVRAVGSDREHPVDVRIIAASNSPLEALVARGVFRADLFYRLDVIGLRLPPLRERAEDLAALVLALARRHGDLYGPIRAVEPDLVRRLAQLHLPGNVRELEHLVERMLFAKASGDLLVLADLPPRPEDEPRLVRACEAAAASAWAAICEDGVGYGEAVRHFETSLLGRALGSPTRTRRELAELLRISERSLYKKLRALQVGRGAGDPVGPERGGTVPARSSGTAEALARRPPGPSEAESVPVRD